VTSGVPTPKAQVGAVLPIGTLILTQLNRPLARTPDQQIIALPDDRFKQGAPNGRYGIRYKQNNTAFDLQLVDYSTTPETLKDIPQGQGMSGPAITWRRDSSGFAFFDFPSSGQQRISTILNYDIASGQTTKLIPDQAAGKIASPVEFSPDNKYLLYAVGSASAEGIGGPDSQPFLLDIAASKSTPLQPDSLRGFSQWLRDVSGFLVLRADQTSAAGSAVYLYRLNNLNNPQRLTPAGISDMLVDVSPDGKRIAVTSAPSGQAANVFMMNLDGTNRRKLTAFTDIEQTITALVWGTDGIYYGLSSANNQETIWRMDLDGTNAVQVANGTLYAVIGSN
jgi:Tol biopolymer transport system component